MRSQQIKVKNLPIECLSAPAIRVKPKVILYLLMLIGIVLLFVYSYYAIIGAILIVIATFSLLVLPDHDLVRFTKDYLVLYNNRDRSMCSLVYWDEIVNWRYERHSTNDYLVISMVDGSSQNVEMFSKASIQSYMDLYAPGKELKTARR